MVSGSDGEGEGEGDGEESKAESTRLHQAEMHSYNQKGKDSSFTRGEYWRRFLLLRKLPRRLHGERTYFSPTTPCAELPFAAAKLTEGHAYLKANIRYKVQYIFPLVSCNVHNDIYTSIHKAQHPNSIHPTVPPISYLF